MTYGYSQRLVDAIQNDDSKSLDVALGKFLLRNDIPVTEFEVVDEYDDWKGGTIKVYSYDGIGIYIGDYENAPDEAAASYEKDEMGDDFDDDDDE